MDLFINITGLIIFISKSKPSIDIRTIHIIKKRRGLSVVSFPHFSPTNICN